MKIAIPPFRPSSLLKTASIFTAALCAAFSARADATADFSQGIGTDSPSHQFVGSIGEGWATPWTTSSLNTTLTTTVTNTNPIRGSDNYLQVSLDGGADASRRSSIYRALDTTIASSAYTISFTLRADDLTGWSSGDFFGIFGINNPRTNTTSDGNQTWGILIQGADAGIGLRNGDTGNPQTVKTGLNFVTGGSYSFILNIDPENASWQAIISDGTTTFTSGDLLYRGSNVVGNYIHFNTLQSSDADKWIYSLDGLNITTPIPESSTVMIVLALAATISIPLIRKRSRR